MTAPLHRPAEAAKLLGISVKTLIGFARDGEIRYINVSRGAKKTRRMFTDQDIEEFKERRARRDVPCPFTSTKTARSTTTISNSRVIGFTARRALRASERQRPSKG
jgi:DNA-binding transcriptional MerR regulator